MCEIYTIIRNMLVNIHHKNIIEHNYYNVKHMVVLSETKHKIYSSIEMSYNETNDTILNEEIVETKPITKQYKPRDPNSNT